MLKCYDSHTVSAVRKWFYRFRFTKYKVIDGVGQEILINTLCEVVDSVGESRDYLTHENDPDKAQYSKSDVIQFGEGWSTFYSAGRSRDCAFEIVTKLTEGSDLRAMVGEYGRDFVYHYNSYKQIAFEIQLQDREKGFCKK